MKKSKKIEVFKGERVTYYDNFINHFFPNYDFVMNSIPKLLKGILASVTTPRILVVGCGTGNETKKIVGCNEEWRVDACDPSQEMINIAGEKLSAYKNLRLIHGTIEDIKSTHKYDIITLFLVLHFLSDDGEKESLLQNIANKLDKGGKFILFDICGTQEELEQNFDILSYSFPDNWLQEEKDMRKERILNVLNVIDEERLTFLLDKVGFKKPAKFHQSTISRAWLITKK